MTLANRILSFHKNLKLNIKLPKGVQAMNPYQDKITFSICEKFYKKFYDDESQRTMILGINPGRHGGGITGIPFTDPVKLESLGIQNDFQKKRELSADFVYQTIDAFGGAKKFYQKFYFSSISPLGFTKDEKNLNYYDLKGLPELLDKFIVECMNLQLSWGINKKVCFCLGEGENFKFLNKLNTKYSFFEEIIPLPHPRFIMQYRRKKLGQFINLYLERLAQNNQ
jgi:Domain of unknown function (DUF4918)